MKRSRHWKHGCLLFCPNHYCKQPYLAGEKPQRSRQYRQSLAHFDNPELVTSAVNLCDANVVTESTTLFSCLLNL